jgi:cytochrome c oxidase cbb3-type subunit I
MTEVASRKAMTLGEGGLSIIFTLTAFLSIVAAAKAEDAPFAFHAWLAAAASIAAVIAIFSNYQDRPATLPAQEISDR